jgi:hypothetical protein
VPGGRGPLSESNLFGILLVPAGGDGAGGDAAAGDAAGGDAAGGDAAAGDAAAADCVLQLAHRVSAAVSAAAHHNSTAAAAAAAAPAAAPATAVWVATRLADSGSASLSPDRPAVDRVLTSICVKGLRVLCYVATCVNFASFLVQSGVLERAQGRAAALRACMGSGAFLQCVVGVLRTAPRSAAWLAARAHAVDLVEVTCCAPILFCMYYCHFLFFYLMVRDMHI